MKPIIFLIFITVSSVLQAQVIHVPGDYPTIASGIAAAGNGDTVLVDPGLYSENIDFNGKNICLASLYLLSQDPVYISQTIIDPSNYDTSSVKFENGEDTTAVLAGFTIYGGSTSQGSGICCRNSSPTLRNLIITGGGPGFWGGYGGGIYLENSQAKLKDLIITENYSTGGGGIYMEYSSPTLENVTIMYNDANFGGGICSMDSAPVFDSISRCNIFFNHAQLANEIYSSAFMNVIVDTFTVCYPGPIIVSPDSNFAFDILNCKIDQVEADLWVSPDGSNDSSGLTEETPLKTISYALSKILADSLNRHTVHLLEGLYSPSASGESFPVTLPRYVDLVGESKEAVILDAGGSSSVISITDNPYVSISDITLLNGHADNGAGGGGIYCTGSNPQLRNLVITENAASHWSSGQNGGGAFFSYSNPVLENILIKDNRATHGGGIYFMYGNVAWLKNVVITGNESFGGSGIEGFQSTLLVDNTTIADNLEGSGIMLGDAWATINNSIIWGNEGGQVSSSVQVKYSDIMGGYEGDGNIDQDPVFTSVGENPYALSEFSPCIDSGKPDTTGLGLPLWDILGNYRVWDGDSDGFARIDMGAYEFGADPVGVGESAVPGRRSAVRVFPNPCKEVAIIEYFLEKPEWVSLSVYNNLGQKVEVLVDEKQDTGMHQVTWKAENYPPGIYFLRTSNIEHRTSNIGKVVLVR